MSVIVDTCVWLAALTRKPLKKAAYVVELGELIREGRVVVLGPIRQEILSGVHKPDQFHQIQEALRAFPDVPLVPEDYELAAEYRGLCYRENIAAAETTLLICAVSKRHTMPILTFNPSFEAIAEHVPTYFYKPRTFLSKLSHGL